MSNVSRPPPDLFVPQNVEDRTRYPSYVWLSPKTADCVYMSGVVKMNTGNYPEGVLESGLCVSSSFIVRNVKRVFARGDESKYMLGGLTRAPNGLFVRLDKRREEITERRRVCEPAEKALEASGWKLSSEERPPETGLRVCSLMHMVANIPSKMSGTATVWLRLGNYKCYVFEGANFTLGSGPGYSAVFKFTASKGEKEFKVSSPSSSEMPVVEINGDVFNRKIGYLVDELAFEWNEVDDEGEDVEL